MYLVHWFIIIELIFIVILKKLKFSFSNNLKDKLANFFLSKTDFSFALTN